MEDRLRAARSLMVAAAVIAPVLAITGCGSGSSGHSGASPASSTLTSVSVTGEVTATAQIAPAPARVSSPRGPTLASCVSAWNENSSGSDRQRLNVVAAQGSPDVVVATYSGPTVTVAQVGGGPNIPVRANVCLVIAGTSVYVQQASRAWRPSEAILTGNFSAYANPATSQQQANAEASTGIAGQSDVGLLTASGGSLVSLSPQDVGGTTTGSRSATGGLKTSARPLAIDSLVEEINTMINLNGDTSGNGSATSSCVLSGSDGTEIAVSAPVNSAGTDLCVGTIERAAGITWKFLDEQPPTSIKPTCTLSDNGEFMGAVITIMATRGNVRDAEGACAGVVGYSLLDSPWVVVGSSPGSQAPPTATTSSSTASGTATSPAPTGTATTQYCIDAWNSEASKYEKQAALSWAGGDDGLAATNTQNDPSLCTITIGNSSQEFTQFNQSPSRDGFEEGAKGPFSEIPSSFSWNVMLNADGSIAAK
jgi:hypothetical protein